MNFKSIFLRNKDSPVVLNLLRKGEKLNISVTPTSAGLLGIGRTGSADQIFDLKTIKYGFLSINSCRY